MIKINWKKDKNRIIWTIVILVVAAIATRILIWEHNYLQEKEGSERAAAISSPTEEEVDETPVTEEQVAEYTVAADRPRYLSIPALGIKNSRVIAVGLSASGQLQTPNNIFDVGWYTGSGKPGSGGTLVIDGHNGGPNVYGVFKRLPELTFGDAITIERGDGAVFNYQVVENESYLLKDANAQMNRMFTSPAAGKESLSLITCTGEWSQVQQTYLSRQFLRAVLITE